MGAADKPIIRVTAGVPAFGIRGWLKRHSPTYRFELASYKKGIRGTSRAWLVAALVLYGFRLVRKAGAKRATLAATEILQPGQGVLIRALAPPPDGKRR